MMGPAFLSVLGMIELKRLWMAMKRYAVCHNTFANEYLYYLFIFNDHNDHGSGSSLLSSPDDGDRDEIAINSSDGDK